MSASYGSSSADYAVLDTVVHAVAKNVYNVAVAVNYQDFLIRVSQTELVPSAIPISETVTSDYTVKDTFDSVGFQYHNGNAIVLGEFARRTENNAPIQGVPLDASKQYNPSPSLITPGGGTYGTWSASLRYDIVRNVALKAQVSRPQEANGIYWVTADPASSARVNVYSIGADFVF